MTKKLLIVRIVLSYEATAGYSEQAHERAVKNLSLNRISGYTVCHSVGKDFFVVFNINTSSYLGEYKISISLSAKRLKAS